MIYTLCQFFLSTVFIATLLFAQPPLRKGELGVFATQSITRGSTTASMSRPSQPGHAHDLLHFKLLIPRRLGLNHVGQALKGDRNNPHTPCLFD
jgi:hypothetical protein